ncbi:MAG: hypothetical protein LC778_03180 [Acidobacteria bacterium]|nr:hypothetical protein [Acidobacteriota bacterium]
MPTINQTIRKINSFAQLPKGWHYGDGKPITQEMIEQAIEFLLTAEEQNIDDISITKESKGQIIWDIYEQSYEVAEEILWEISQESQIISVSSISSTGTLETKDSEVHSFNVHQKNKTPLEVFQLSRQNASKKVNEQFVNIYRTFTAQSQATQPSFCP